jgi:hypothetical protein
MYLCRSKKEKKDLQVAENIRLKNKGILHKDEVARVQKGECCYCTYNGDNWVRLGIHRDMSKCRANQATILAFANDLKEIHKEKELEEKKLDEKEYVVLSAPKKQSSAESECIESLRKGYELLSQKLALVQMENRSMSENFSRILGALDAKLDTFICV